MSQAIRPRLLTIAIPTFNRNAVLAQNLNKLLPQMDERSQLLIIDNGSKIPIRDTLANLLSQYPQLAIQLIRNPVNIGGNANVLRCVELCNTEYIWILGDDDFPTNNALETIYRYISSRDTVWVNFYSPDPRNQPERSTNTNCLTLAKYLGGLKSISELVFVSNNIYRTAYIKRGLEFGHIYQEKMAPHLVAMLAGIELEDSDGVYFVCNDRLFESISNNDDPASAWPLYRAFLGIMSLHRVPFNKSTATRLLDLVRGARSRWLSNRCMFYAFAELSRKEGRWRSFLISADFVLSLIIVDRVASIVSVPIYLIAILCGAAIEDSWRVIAAMGRNLSNKVG